MVSSASQGKAESWACDLEHAISHELVFMGFCRQIIVMLGV